jgi:hypothetical protein
MAIELNPDQLAVVRVCAAGQLGARECIERAELHDYADLITALAQADLDFPKPADTLARNPNLALAREILEPRLRRGDCRPPHPHCRAPANHPRGHQ